MYRSVIFLLVFHQANACLDLLVRSFNEVFSPMVETGDGRIRKPHKVDDLTDYYKIDDSGNIIPNTQLVSSPHFNIDQMKSANEDEEFLLQSRNLNPMVECRSRVSPESIDRESSSFSTPLDQFQENMASSSPIPENSLRKKRKYRRGYAPGKRPLVDFFIKLIETFQLTANAKFITSRPRYGNGQLQYVPDT